MSIARMIAKAVRFVDCHNVLPGTPPRLSATIGSCPSTNVRGSPEIPSRPAVNGVREVPLPAQLVGALLAHTEELSDLNEAEELSGRHRQIPRTAVLCST